MSKASSVIPMLPYEDGIAALKWLVEAFGFREVRHLLDEKGRLTHGELAAGQGLIMLAEGSQGYESPNHHRQHCETARRRYSFRTRRGTSRQALSRQRPGRPPLDVYAG